MLGDLLNQVERRKIATIKGSENNIGLFPPKSELRATQTFQNMFNSFENTNPQPIVLKSYLLVVGFTNLVLAR